MLCLILIEFFIIEGRLGDGFSKVGSNLRMRGW